MFEFNLNHRYVDDSKYKMYKIITLKFEDDMGVYFKQAQIGQSEN